MIGGGGRVSGIMKQNVDFDLIVEKKLENKNKTRGFSGVIYFMVWPDLAENLFSMCGSANAMRTLKVCPTS